MLNTVLILLSKDQSTHLQHNFHQDEKPESGLYYLELNIIQLFAILKRHSNLARCTCTLIHTYMRERLRHRFTTSERTRPPLHNCSWTSWIKSNHCGHGTSTVLYKITKLLLHLHNHFCNSYRLFFSNIFPVLCSREPTPPYLLFF